jgi:prepilin-type N-terminal cleavage/methylation domain-containing protein/prepilin-type processing-associated H-X9-DG protein
MPRHQKTAFTLVELLVSITIIGILIALLLPAVQATREAARLMQCRANLRQVGLAVLNYENQWHIFPPSSCWSNGLAPDQISSVPYYRENWAILVLPFLENQPLFDQFDLSKPISGNGTSPRNIAARATRLSVMLCPTDRYNSVPFQSIDPTSQMLGDNWARGNYAANAALGQMMPGSGKPTFCFLSTSPGWPKGYLRGVMGANCAITMADMTDGASCTVLLGEIRAGVHSVDPRGCWAMAGGASALWGHGAQVMAPREKAMDDAGPNNNSNEADDSLFCMYVRLMWRDPMGGDDLNLMAEGMPCYGGHAGNIQIGMRSTHQKGANACFADGSVHWISDSIQTYPSTAPDQLSVWDRLMASADGLPVSGDSF